METLGWRSRSSEDPNSAEVPIPLPYWLEAQAESRWTVMLAGVRRRQGTERSPRLQLASTRRSLSWLVEVEKGCVQLPIHIYPPNAPQALVFRLVFISASSALKERRKASADWTSGYGPRAMSKLAQPVASIRTEVSAGLRGQWARMAGSKSESCGQHQRWSSRCADV